MCDNDTVFKPRTEEQKRDLRDIQDELSDRYAIRVSWDTIVYVARAIVSIFPPLWRNDGTDLTESQEKIVSEIPNRSQLANRDRILDLIEGVLKYAPKNFVSSLSEGGDQI